MALHRLANGVEQVTRKRVVAQFAVDALIFVNGKDQPPSTSLQCRVRPAEQIEQGLQVMSAIDFSELTDDFPNRLIKPASNAP